MNNYKHAQKAPRYTKRNALAIEFVRILEQFDPKQKHPNKWKLIFNFKLLFTDNYLIY